MPHKALYNDTYPRDKSISENDNLYVFISSSMEIEKQTCILEYQWVYVR